MSGRHRPRRSSLPTKSRVSKKLATLKGAAVLKSGGLLAHATATLPGVAANPRMKVSVRRLMRFKQRPGPFLLLADSIPTALGLVRFFSPALRRQARDSWPGPVTLLFPARPGLARACYQKGMLAVRVDADPTVRALAKRSGGLLLSSSLNRKGGAVNEANYRSHMRWRRHLGGRIAGQSQLNSPSTIMRIRRNHCTLIRP